MRYMINQISNRDRQLLYEYRILRQPSDYLSPIVRDAVQTTQILSGKESTEQFDDYRLFEFDLELDMQDGKIPYLEFKTSTKSDFRNLQSLVYLDGTKLLGFTRTFEKPVDVSIYFVESLNDIELLINQYLKDLKQLRNTLDSLRDKLNKKLGTRESFIITGRDQNLIQFAKQDDELIMEDSHYKLVTTLVGQTLVNPSQTVLSLIPKILSHDLLIRVTDRKTRVLQGFSGFTIFITGNGDWVFRDMKSTVNIAATTVKPDVKAFNCSLLYLRSNSNINAQSSKIELSRLFVHRTNCILNDGIVGRLRAIGQSTIVSINGSIQEVEYLGPGSTVDCMIRNARFNPKNILGSIYVHGFTNDTANTGIILGSVLPSATYRSGHRIGFLQGQTDFELLPNRIVSVDVDKVHIHDASEKEAVPDSDEPEVDG